MVMRDHPGDVGLRPFGDTGAEPLCAPPRSSAPIIATALGALRDAAKTRVFWILFATFFICGASTTGLVQVHLIPMCVDYGIPQVQAAGLFAAMGLFDFVGTTTSGWLSDRRAASRFNRSVQSEPLVFRMHRSEFSAAIVARPLRVADQHLQNGDL